MHGDIQKIFSDDIRPSLDVKMNLLKNEIFWLAAASQDEEIFEGCDILNLVIKYWS